MGVRFFSPQLFPQQHRIRPAKDAVFIGVMRYRTSIAPQPFPERPQVLFRTVVLCETCIETAGGIIDHRNQLTSRAHASPTSETENYLASCVARGGATSWPSPSTCAAS